jgi:dihydrofolate reductase
MNTSKPNTYWTAIAGLSLNRVIGKDNDLPWPRIQADMDWFRKMTSGQTIVMGRKTFESMGSRPLPKRLNVVISRQNISLSEGVLKVHSIDEIGNLEAQGDIFIIGGAQIYELALPHCQDLYLTWIKREVEGDVTFPAFEHLFEPKETIFENDEIKIIHYAALTPQVIGDS